jgi:hypothetical protein
MPGRGRLFLNQKREPMSSRIGKTMALIVVLTLVPAVAADDWPMFGRDRSRNGVSPEKNPPIWWQVADNEGPNLQRSKNIKWQAKLGANTNCDPVIAKGLVWVGTSVQDAKSKTRSGALVGPANPAPLFNRSDFWAQGVNFGLEFRF